MKRILTTLLFISVFVMASLSANAEIKILDLGFDNSDSLIYVKSSGELVPKTLASDTIVPQTTVVKGVLSNPQRVYFDITNATLTTQSKSWTLKNSKLDTVKISQFSLNPNVVRVVATYNSGSANDFEVFANNEQILLKYNGINKKMVQSTEFSNVYKGAGNSDPLFENAVSTQDAGPVVPVSNVTASEKQYYLSSRYFINNVTQAQKGLLVGGLGEASIKPALYLTNPQRMVVDIENAVLAANLRNKTFYFENTPSDTTGKEILRMGQFEKNTVRLVVEGANAANYRVVISPDLQNLYVAKRPDVVNAKLTSTLASVLGYATAKTGNESILAITLSKPATLSTFEEGGNFYLDIQNAADANQGAFDNLIKNPQFSNIKITKIAADKLRYTFPLTQGTQVDVMATDDAKKVRVYFREPQKPVITAEPPKSETPKAEPPKAGVQKSEPVISAPPKNTKKDPPKIESLYKVVIDPGHGGSDVGATREGIFEKDITLDISNLVVKNLNKQKVFTEMTRSTDKSVALSERSDFSNNIAPDIFVSIHVNSSTKEDIIGVETHWWREDSTELARAIQTQMTTPKRLLDWKTKDRGLFKSQFYVINHTTSPAVLVEIGFISNAAERAGLINKKRQEDIAQAITDGIMNYLKQGKK